MTTVDRTHENDPTEPAVYVTLEDGYEEKLWIPGLTDAEYIDRVKSIRKLYTIGDNLGRENQ